MLFNSEHPSTLLVDSFYSKDLRTKERHHPKLADDHRSGIVLIQQKYYPERDSLQDHKQC
jgi:hypothetical protein